MIQINVRRVSSLKTPHLGRDEELIANAALLSPFADEDLRRLVLASINKRESYRMSRPWYDTTY